MLTRPPASITKSVARFVGRLVPGATPTWVSVQTLPESLPNDCFNNVESLVAAQGGARAIGWAVWEWPNTYLEAEFHAVWKTEDGRLLDVTPKEGGETQILFVPDSRRSYTGEFVDNPRMPLRDDALISDYITMSKYLFDVTRVGKPGEPVVLDREVVEPIARHQLALGEMLKRGMRDHDPCFCGSGKKYKKCHTLARAK
jgi:SEC-C motif